MTYDPRYLNDSFVTNEYTVQNENGIYDLIVNNPSYYYYVYNPLNKKTYTYNFWSRPTIPWSLDCEYNTPDGTRADQFSNLQTTLPIPDAVLGMQHTAQYMVLLVAFFTFAPACLTCCAFGCSGCNSEVASGGIAFFGTFGRLCAYGFTITILIKTIMAHG